MAWKCLVVKNVLLKQYFARAVSLLHVLNLFFTAVKHSSQTVKWSVIFFFFNGSLTGLRKTPSRSDFSIIPVSNCIGIFAFVQVYIYLAY